MRSQGVAAVGQRPYSFRVTASAPSELVDAARRRAALRHLLDELPHAHAEAVALHLVLGYTVEETAAAVGAPVNTVRSRLRRALSALRRRVNSDSSLLEVVRGAHGWPN
jgi:DNA-directed RNA polymerase specialized sigma24 family protein